MSLSLSDLLKRLMEMSGSDLHITTNSPPQIRVHGHLVPLDLPQMTPADTKQLAYSVMTDAQKHRFEESLELDFSFGLKGLARFRANVFNQRGATSAVFRLIPFEIKSFNQLGLPPVVSKMCDKPRGLVLVTGPTGSGKSTTLAAMIDKINTERHDHILTIEDPIEFVHMNKNCVVNQRDVHGDHGAQCGHPQPDPRRQDPPDLLRHAVWPGQVWDADLQPSSGDSVFPEADHAGVGGFTLQQPRRAAGNDQPWRGLEP